jgi:serine/arginine repetitive matrix protein 2
MMSGRSKAAPLPPVSPRRLSHSPVTPHVAFPSASQVLDVQFLNSSNDESLEEVEFNDLGKFVGTEPGPEETVVPPIQQGDIPTDDQPRTRSDLEPPWRRKVSTATVEEQPSVVANALLEVASESPDSREVDTSPVSPSVPTTSTCAGSPTKSLAGCSLPSQTLVVPSSLPSQRSPRTTSYREELRSTFDDTMSRIKGAMQTRHHRNAMGTEHHHNRTTANSTSHPTEQPRFGRGIPPSQRSQAPRVSEPDEPFTTMAELDNDLQKGQPSRVKLPSPRALQPLSKRELANLKRSIPPLRWDVLSWDPPVEGMSIRDYSVNGVLFREPSSSDAPFPVKLPRPGSHLVRRISPNTPKVHLPVKPLVNKTVVGAGAFGRPRAADESTSWRRTLSSIPDQVESTPSSEGLVTRSGSSPPDTDKASDVTPSVETETIQPTQGPTKSRAEPKMPAGAGVAFYRESTSCPSVSFTVSSELEDARQPETPVMPPSTEELVPLLSQPVGESKDIDGSSMLPAAREKAESKSSDGSVSYNEHFLW